MALLILNEVLVVFHLLASRRFYFFDCDEHARFCFGYGKKLMSSTRRKSMSFGPETLVLIILSSYDVHHRSIIYKVEVKAGICNCFIPIKSKVLLLVIVNAHLWLIRSYGVIWKFNLEVCTVAKVILDLFLAWVLHKDLGCCALRFIVGG